jgi:Domain of unknown function (DUF4432)
MDSHPERSSRAFTEDRTGRLSQIGGISSFTHADGKAKGVSTLRVRTARGLELWVVPDRGIDIFEASFLGRSLTWHSPTGMVHAAYFSNSGLDWLKNFPGGLLSTCGLTTVGSPSEDEGENLGLHGVISNTPAESVNWSESWRGDDCLLSVSGKVRETSVHGPNMLLERTITTSLQSTSFSVNDLIENLGVRETPFMLLYHFNFGYPLLTERSRIYAPSLAVEPADDLSARSMNGWNRMERPERGARERVYFHSMQPDPTGRVTVVLVSDDTKPDLGLSLSYNSDSLPEFVQWKMTGSNHFVLGLEPANCRTLGRSAERRRGTLQFLAPGEKRAFHLEVAVLEGEKEVARAIDANGLK